MRPEQVNRNPCFSFSPTSLAIDRLLRITTERRVPRSGKAARRAPPLSDRVADETSPSTPTEEAPPRPRKAEDQGRAIPDKVA
jgi:hypothetical protein